MKLTPLCFRVFEIWLTSGSYLFWCCFQLFYNFFFELDSFWEGAEPQLKVCHAHCFVAKRKFLFMRRNFVPYSMSSRLVMGPASICPICETFSSFGWQMNNIGATTLNRTTFSMTFSLTTLKITSRNATFSISSLVIEGHMPSVVLLSAVMLKVVAPPYQPKMIGVLLWVKWIFAEVTQTWWLYHKTFCGRS